MTLECRGERKRFRRVARGKRVPAAQIRALSPRGVFQCLGQPFCNGERLDQIHPDVGYFGLVFQTTHGIHSGRATEQCPQFTQNLTCFEEILGGAVANELAVHIIVQWMNSKRQPSAYAGPKQVLARRQIFQVDHETLQHRLDAGVPRRWKWTGRLRYDLAAEVNGRSEEKFVRCVLDIGLGSQRRRNSARHEHDDDTWVAETSYAHPHRIPGSDGVLTGAQRTRKEPVNLASGMSPKLLVARPGWYDLTSTVEGHPMPRRKRRRSDRLTPLELE